ncbi:MAG: hypothetical protein Q9228_007134 [Teloschistes exilis]
MPPKTPEPKNSQKPDYKPGSNQAGLKQRCAEACAAVEAFQAFPEELGHEEDEAGDGADQ